jgi:hypothetical protein
MIGREHDEESGMEAGIEGCENEEVENEKRREIKRV